MSHATTLSRKKLPIGIQTFAQIREDNCYYMNYSTPMRCKGWSFTGAINSRLGQFLTGYGFQSPAQHYTR